jgi:hypothetical protein
MESEGSMGGYQRRQFWAPRPGNKLTGDLQAMVDTKLDAIVKRKIIHYLGDNDEDLAMFVNEHLKDHKGPGKLAEGLEPVRSNTVSLYLD